MKVKGKGDENKVLFLVSGGPNSLSMTFMAGESLNGNSFSKRKMFFSGEILHVDESCFYQNEESETSQENMEKLKMFSEDISMKLNILKIEEVFDFTKEQALEMLSSAKNRGSCREDIIEILRNRAIHKFCKENDFMRIASGDNGLRVNIFWFIFSRLPLMHSMLS